MPSNRKNTKMEMGDPIKFLKMILIVSLTFLFMILLVLPFTPRNSPEFVVTVLTIIVNSLTALSSTIAINILLNIRRRREKELELELEKKIIIN